MASDLKEQIDTLIRLHPEASINEHHDLAVPIHTLSAIIADIFLIFDVGGFEKQEAEIMAMHIREKEAPTDVTSDLLLRFILEDEGCRLVGEEALSPASPRGYTNRQSRPYFGLRSRRDFKADTNRQTSRLLDSSDSPLSRRQTCGKLTVRNPDFPSDCDVGLEGDSHSCSLITGNPDAAMPSGRSLGTESSVESTMKTLVRERRHAIFFNVDQPWKRWSRSRSPRSSTIQVVDTESEPNSILEGKEIKSKSKRGQGVLQRVPRVSRTPPIRLRDNLTDHGSTPSHTRTLPVSPRSDTSGYSADLSEDQLDSPFVMKENGVEELDKHGAPEQSVSFSHHNSCRASTPARRRDTPPGQSEKNTDPDAENEIHLLLSLTKTEFDLERSTSMQTTPFIGQDRVGDFQTNSQKPPSNHFTGCSGTTASKHVIPNLSAQIRNIIGPLKAGGFCDVYLGELERGSGCGELVAMKMLRVFGSGLQVIKAKKKFRREIDLWLSLHHPHVLGFYGTYEVDENRLCMVSPWAHGGNAMEYLKRSPIANRGRLLWQTSKALEYLHSGKDVPQIVHGDLKADNVLISATGDALLCDFGLSRHIKEVISSSRSSSTCHGGNIRFMAPELIVAPRGACRPTKTTPASDVFAFASLMLQFYTEKPPFGELSEVQSMFKIVNGEIPDRPKEDIHLQRGMKNCLWALMVECWQFDAADRPTMADISSRLSALR